MSRVMALDVGDRTVGVAVSDPTRLIAQGVTTVRRTRPAEDVAAIEALIAEHEVDLVVVGWPLHLSGRMSGQARKVAKFQALLEAAIELPVERWDERLSTVAAHNALIEGGMRRERRKRVVDKVAATLILQGWLDAQPREQGNPG